MTDGAATKQEIDMSNIQTAQDLAAKFTIDGDQYDRLPQPSTGWVGEDSDFPTRYWRVGGNAVVVQGPWGLEAKRWHDLVAETRDLRYPAR